MPTKEEIQITREDQSMIESFKEYKRPFEDEMQLGARVWNMIADPAPRDDISNVFIGIARMIGQVAVASMSEGRPEFGFRAGTSEDRVKMPMWEAGIDHIFELSNYDSKQYYFLTDYVALGFACFEAVPQLPMHKVRHPKEGGGFEETYKRDKTRPKFEVRHRSPFEVWVDPSAPTLDEVKRVYDERYITEKEFEQEYVNAKLPNGNYKYTNTEDVKVGQTVSFSDDGELTYRDAVRKDKIVIGTWQDEYNDVLRVYANGRLILDSPLQIKELPNGERTTGMNAMGKHSFAFAQNEHQYDSNERTHSLYGMGIPYAMRGFDALYQALTNMTIDNIRLQNTVGISYQPFDGTSALDLDSRDFYSGDFIDGKIDTHPFGQSNAGTAQFMWEQLDNWSIFLTGVNFKQLFDGGAKTAFELSQRIRAQNSRFEHKLKIMENGCFKKLGRLCISGVMSELTTTDWEELTDKEAKEFKSKIKEKKVPAEEFRFKGKKMEHQLITKVRVKGMSITENLTNNSRRALKPGSIDNTLEFGGKSETDSFVPVVPEYFWSIEYAETGGIPDVYVRSARMLGDDQDLRFARINAAMNLARARKAEDPETRFDLAKLEGEYVNVLDIPEEEIFKEEDEDGILDEIKNMKEMVLSGGLEQQQAGFQGEVETGLPEVPQPSALGETSNQLTSPLG